MQTNPNGMTSIEVLEIAKRSYTYGFPLVMMHLTKMDQINVSEPTAKGHAPINQIGKARKFPTSKTTDVVKPNVDTYYNLIWFDLSQGPFVLYMPSTENVNDNDSRYYLLPFLDAYSNVVESPGKRHTGGAPGTYLITKTGYTDEMPEGMTHIALPTNMSWMVGRIQANSDVDGAEVVWPIEDQMTLTPLANWGDDNYTPPAGEQNAIGYTEPVEYVFTISIDDFFNLMIDLMGDNPPAKVDPVIIEAMESIGIAPGLDFSLDSFDIETQNLLKKIPDEIVRDWTVKMQTKITNEGANQNNWISFTEDIGRFGLDYLQRAFIAFKGLGANIIEDAIYPVCQMDIDNDLLKGGENYMITFTEDQLPPINAFWSLTCYNSEDFLVENKIDKYSVGSRDSELVADPETGITTIYIQPTMPDSGASNWLPSPSSGLMSLTLRLYWPQESVINGTWVPSPVEKNP